MLRQGRAEDALRELRQARALSPQNPRAAADLGYALSVSGHEAEARAVLEELRRIALERAVSPYDFAVVHAGLGETDAALTRLEQGYREGATGLRWLKVEPIFQRLRGEVRFRELLGRIGLPD